jgi:hypothetical protein
MTRMEVRRQLAEARRHPQANTPQPAAYPGPASDWTPGIVRADDERRGT